MPHALTNMAMAHLTSPTLQGHGPQLPGLSPLGGAAFVGNEALAKIFLQHDAEAARGVLMRNQRIWGNLWERLGNHEDMKMIVREMSPRRHFILNHTMFTSTGQLMTLVSRRDEPSGSEWQVSSNDRGDFPEDLARLNGHAAWIS